MNCDSNKFSDLRDTNSIPSPPLIDVADLLSHDRMQRAMSDTILSSTDKRFMDDTMPVYSGSIRAPSRSSPVSPAPSNPLDDYFLCDDTAPTNNNQHGNTVLIYKEPSHHSSLPSDHASAKNDTLSNDDKNGSKVKFKHFLNHLKPSRTSISSSSRRTSKDSSSSSWRDSSDYSILSHLSWQPPAPHGAHYVKLRPRHKHVKDMERLIHAQTLTMNTGRSNEHGNAIWAMNFSPDGKYMAAVGQDHVIRIWKVRDGAQAVEQQENEDGDSHQHSHRTNRDIREEHMSINVFDEDPVKEFVGHTDDILALRWSKNHFLLSASLDNTVMLWHVSVNECLCLFQHVDFVTGVAFHPMDDRYFVSGSTDGKVRIWNIPKKCVVSWASSPDKSVITAVGFTPDGKTVCAGSTNGQLFLYDTEKLKYRSKMELKRRHAKRGRKITGIEIMPRTTEPIVLVTSNDSEVRLIHVGDKHVLHRYIGAENESSQIKAAPSDDGQYIACGSDKHTVHIWGTYSPSSSSDRERNLKTNSNVNLAENVFGKNNGDFHDDERNKLSNGRLSHWLHSGDQQWQERLYNHERYFTAGRGIVTRVIFAPTAARQQLAISGTDMIYNHTPIMYVHHDASKPSSKDNPDIRVSHCMPRVEKDSYENQEELLERAKYDYTDGHILVTASDKGEIKVWRFDSGVYPGMSSGITGLSDMFRPSRRASFANGTLPPDHRPTSGSFSSVGARPSFRALRRASKK
ncbi:hypothetical protein O0I10_011696 [Lichtheimia ornata]|uniref:WD40 repeat-like protein n=1 Tax=Lichtheimia ornata TaxID=688661 RepID=A0AAD7USD1_9FUNG|nr:uncharacterized protein O0I10_011696 [Lichtheimia ornata]KAJ8652689.1 hypothetical protein O0I10_011696 [Lichtheimia ornata]